jgi:ribosome recycling factor
MVKLTRKNGEECKVAVRKHRRDAQRDDRPPRQGRRRQRGRRRPRKKKVEDLTSELVKQVDGVIASKEKDVMEV